jgi:hypothetical protein
MPAFVNSGDVNGGDVNSGRWHVQYAGLLVGLSNPQLITCLSRDTLRGNVSVVRCSCPARGNWHGACVLWQEPVSDAFGGKRRAGTSELTRFG